MGGTDFAFADVWKTGPLVTHATDSPRKDAANTSSAELAKMKARLRAQAGSEVRR